MREAGAGASVIDKVTPKNLNQHNCKYFWFEEKIPLPLRRSLSILFCVLLNKSLYYSKRPVSSSRTHQQLLLLFCVNVLETVEGFFYSWVQIYLESSANISWQINFKTKQNIRPSSIVPKILETSGLNVFFRSWWPGDRDNVPLHLPVADDVRVAVVDALPFPDLVEGAALSHVTDLDVISRSRGCLSWPQTLRCQGKTSLSELKVEL